MLSVNADPSFAKQTARRALGVGALLILAAAVLVACEGQQPKAQAAPAAASVPVVQTAQVVQSLVESAPQQLGRVEAAQRVELQARVAGPIDAVLFREGSLVRAGQPLFQIDPRPFDAAVARLRAELKFTQARESLAASEAERAKQLHAERAIAAEEFERRASAHAEAQARRAAAEAALQTALLEREFTLVRAPIAGRIGRALVTVGNFVVAGPNPTLLSSIVSVAPLDVHFDVSERRVLEQLGADRAMKGWTVRLLAADGQRELARVPLDFANHSIDPGTGTLRLRARVGTPGPELSPGQYVHVQLLTGQAAPALLVPDKAVGTDQGRRFVLVVGATGEVEYRAVTVGTSLGAQRIVSSGLKTGEQVIVSGLMRVRPGMTVKPQQSAETAKVQTGAAKPL